MKLPYKSFQYLPNNYLMRGVYEQIVDSASFVHVSEKSTVCVVTCNKGFEMVGVHTSSVDDSVDREMSREYALQDVLTRIMKSDIYRGEIKSIVREIQ